MTHRTGRPPRSTVLAGVEVPRIGFAGLHLAGPHGWGLPRDRAAVDRLLRHALDLGIRYIDTADTLGPGVSEQVVGDVLRSSRIDGVLVATKGGMTRTSAGPSGWGVLGHPAYLKQQAQTSRIRLGLERIPLYFLHRIDPAYALEDQLGALVELREEGVIEHIGLSGIRPGDLRRARAITPIAAVQNHLDVLHRDGLDVLAETTESPSTRFVAFWTLGRGGAVLEHPVVRAVAERRGATAAQIALAYLLRLDPGLLTLPGSSSATRVESNLAALDVELDDRDLDDLDTIPVPSTAPHRTKEPA